LRFADANGFAHFGGARAEVQVEAPLEPLLDEIAIPAPVAALRRRPLTQKAASKAVVCTAATVAQQAA
jgi:hypothetical protein